MRSPYLKERAWAAVRLPALVRKHFKRKHGKNAYCGQL